MAEVTDDIYFNGNEVKGFPIATLMQYSQMQKLYGDCAKYLETGDEITLEAMTLSKDFFDYLMAVTLNGAMAAIPLFSPQPANCPTNIRGGDGDQQIRCFDIRLMQHGIGRAVTLYRHDILGIGDFFERFISLVNNGYGVSFLIELLRDRAADTTASYDNDLHILSSSDGSIIS